MPENIVDRIAGADGAWAFEIEAEPAWERAIPGWREALARVGGAVAPALDEALAEAGTVAPAEVALLLADDATVQGLNRDWRGIDKPTNVLSFATWWDDDCPPPPASDVAVHLGDLAFALSTLLAEARAEGKTSADHLAHLTVHGLLHLIGYDHGDEEEACAMETLEVRLLAEIGVPDPYGGDRDDD
jgi:probable rRNA maturation factor